MKNLSSIIHLHALPSVSLRVVLILSVLMVFAGFGSASAWNGGIRWLSSHKTYVKSVITTPQLAQPFLVGTCDLGGSPNNIEVESSGGTALAGYSTLQLAFAEINAGTHTGIITIDVCGNTNELAVPAVLNAGNDAGTPDYSLVTISPVGTWTITGAPASGSPLIDLNGADNVMIDGLNSPGNLLTISNTTIGTTAGTSTIRFIADATNNIVTNCSILGSSTPGGITAAGTIVFGTGIITGNDDNMISNNEIGPAGANLPSRAIMASGTSSVIENDNVQINGNDIFDFFRPNGGLSSIYILTGNEGWLISNNKFYQTGPRTFTVAVGRYTAITLNNSTGSFTVSGNVIGFGAADGTGITTITGRGNEFRGINVANVSTTTATSIQGNTISGISQTTSRNDVDRPAFIAIAISTDSNATGGLTNVAGNTIGSLVGSSTIVVNSTAATSGSRAAVAAISNVSMQDANVSNNKIGAITIQGTGTRVGFDGILVYTDNSVNATVENNTIGGPGAAGAITDTQTGDYLMSGIRTRYAHARITGNTVRNISSGSNASSLAIRGIVSSGSAGSNTVSQNIVHSLSNSEGGSVWGIDLGYLGSGNVVARNLIHSLSTSLVATGQLVGIKAGSDDGPGARTTYLNNMVRLGVDAAGHSITLGMTVYGIVDTDGGRNNFYHNSVYIGGSGVDSSSDTFAFISTVTTATRVCKNNIFFNNRSNGTGTALNVAYGPSGTPPAMSGLDADYNDYFAPNVNGVAIRNGSTNYTVSTWQTATAGANQQDLHSFDSLNPQFISPDTSEATVDLHIMPTSPVLGLGISLSSVTNDFDNDLRGPFPDIGADELVAPTSAPANVSGHLVDNTGAPLAGVTMTLLDTILVQNRTTVTDGNGNYHFDAILTGRQIVVTPSKNGYTFSPQNRAFNLTGDIVTVDFTGTPDSSQHSVGSDFDGDGLADLSVFRPSVATWYTLLSATNVVKSEQWGLGTDRIAPADYDCDYITDIAVFRPSTGSWYIKQSSTSTLRAVNWGLADDVITPADFDGDGQADIAVWRPSNGTWYVIESRNGQSRTVSWGTNGDCPVAADYDGDGRTDMAVWRPSTGTWYVLKSSDGTYQFQHWGIEDDRPVVGDYDGDHISDLAVFRSTTATWYVKFSASGSNDYRGHGTAVDILAPGDYDGDGKTDRAVWQLGGDWNILRSTTDTTFGQKWGTTGDIPTTSAYVR